MITEFRSKVTGDLHRVELVNGKARCNCKQGFYGYECWAVKIVLANNWKRTVATLRAKHITIPDKQILIKQQWAYLDSQKLLGKF